MHYMSTPPPPSFEGLNGNADACKTLYSLRMQAAINSSAPPLYLRLARERRVDTCKTPIFYRMQATINTPPPHCSKAYMGMAELIHMQDPFSIWCRPPSAAPSSRKGSVGSGSSSLLAALAAERDAAADFEAAEESAAERVAAEVRSFFNNIPRVRYFGGPINVTNL